MGQHIDELNSFTFHPLLANSPASQCYIGTQQLLLRKQTFRPASQKIVLVISVVLCFNFRRLHNGAAQVRPANFYSLSIHSSKTILAAQAVTFLQKVANSSNGYIYYLLSSILHLLALGQWWCSLWLCLKGLASSRVSVVCMVGDRANSIVPTPGHWKHSRTA